MDVSVRRCIVDPTFVYEVLVHKKVNVSVLGILVYGS